MAFNGLTKLQNLDISHNQLTIAPLLLHVKNTLQTLDLSWNRITHIGDTYFNLCWKINNVFLDNNQLIEIPNVKNVAQTIAFLSLGFNNISDVKSINGISFPVLKSSHLASNQIRSFCLPPVKFAPRLRDVVLQSNYLSIIDFSHANDSRSPQVEVFLAHNPWHCNDSLYWTQQCTHREPNFLNCMGWLMVDRMVCSSPPEAQGLTPKEAGKLVCDDVIKWKHFPRYGSFVRGIHRSRVNSPNKGQWRGALTDSLICTWANGISKQSRRRWL